MARKPCIWPRYIKNVPKVPGLCGHQSPRHKLLILTALCKSRPNLIIVGSCIRLNRESKYFREDHHVSGERGS